MHVVHQNESGGFFCQRREQLGEVIEETIGSQSVSRIVRYRPDAAEPRERVRVTAHSARLVE